MSNDIMKAPSNMPAELMKEFGGGANDLMSGGGGFPVMSIRASKFRVKANGEEGMLKNEQGDPLGSVEVVILWSQAGLSKNYYAKAYAEGDSSAPNCFSLEGDRPDSQSESKQSASCATCPHAVFGSRITPSGTKAKACADSKRMVVTFAGNMDNEEFGGPMLLRVPAASLKGLRQFAQRLNGRNMDFRAIVTKLSFDQEVSFPKLVFKEMRWLTEDELRSALELRNHPNVQAIMGGASEIGTNAPALGDDFDTSVPPPSAALLAQMNGEAPAAPAAAPAPAKAAPKKAAAKKATPPKAEEELGSILNDLELN